MSNGMVKAEAGAVRRLRSGITRYAEELRGAMEDAKRDAKTVEAAAQKALDRRRTDLSHAERDLARAQQAAEAAARSERGDGGAAARAAAAAAQNVAAAKKAADTAAKAVQAAAELQRDLAKAFSSMDAVVGQNSSVATSALSSLESKLHEITADSALGRLSSFAKGVGVTAEVMLAVADVSKLAGNVSQGHLPTAEHFDSISQMVESQSSDQQQLWRDVRTSELEEHSGDVPDPGSGR